MADFELVTGVLLDPGNKMLVVYRNDHCQWELPGGKLLPPETFVPGAVVDEEELAPISLQYALRDKVGLEVGKDTLNLPKLGRTQFEQGGVTYDTRWYQVMRYSGALSVEGSMYDKFDFVYPLSRTFLRERLSRNIRNFQRELVNRRIGLNFYPSDAVQ